MVSVGFIVLMVAVYLFGFKIAGLPSGIGYVNTSVTVLLKAPFFHGGIVSLVIGCAFLFVLGKNVEDRMGRARFFFFYLVCGVIAGAAHILWGKTGAPAAMGSAGAGGVYRFFPQ